MRHFHVVCPWLGGTGNDVLTGGAGYNGEGRFEEKPYDERNSYETVWDDRGNTYFKGASGPLCAVAASLRVVYARMYHFRVVSFAR